MVTDLPDHMQHEMEVDKGNVGRKRQRQIKFIKQRYLVSKSKYLSI